MFKRKILITVLVFFIIVCNSSHQEYSNPLLPIIKGQLCNVSPNLNVSVASNISIPKTVWISFKYIPQPSDMPDHLQKFITRAKKSGWGVNLMGKDDQANFMNTFYANTSVLWAFNLIHADAGVFASDIWRYAVLYLFGGFYLDDDSYIETALDKVNNVILPTFGQSVILHYLGRLFFLVILSLSRTRKIFTKTIVTYRPTTCQTPFCKICFIEILSWTTLANECWSTGQFSLLLVISFLKSCLKMSWT